MEIETFLLLFLQGLSIHCEGCVNQHLWPFEGGTTYSLNDIENLLSDNNEDIEKKRVLFFPTTYRKPYQVEEVDNANVLQRSEVIKQLAAGRNLIIVTYPEALSEKVVSSKTLTSNTLQVVQGTELSMDFIIEVLAVLSFLDTVFKNT